MVSYRAEPVWITSAPCGCNIDHSLTGRNLFGVCDRGPDSPECAPVPLSFPGGSGFRCFTQERVIPESDWSRGRIPGS